MTQRHKHILDWSDERSVGDGIHVTLIHGFAFEPGCVMTASHHRSFETVREALEAVRRDAQPCQCERCQHP